MDNRKVEQVLKEIFDRYGVEIVHGHDKRFEAAVSDLLDERRYPEERTVLRRASESTALWALINSKSVTDIGAENAVACLERESRMTREDAVFVVRCVVSARGGNPNVVKSQKPDGGGMVSAENARKELVDQKTDNQNTISGTNLQNTSVCLLEAPCNMVMNKERRRGRQYKGKMYLYSNRLEFVPNKRGEQVQLSYQDITKMRPYVDARGVIIGSIIFSIISMLNGVIAGAEMEEMFLWMLILALMWGLPFFFIMSIKILTLFSNSENEWGYKIYYSFSFTGAHKKRAMDIIRKGMQGQL